MGSPIFGDGSCPSQVMDHHMTLKRSHLVYPELVLVPLVVRPEHRGQAGGLLEAEDRPPIPDEVETSDLHRGCGGQCLPFDVNWDS